MKTSYRFRQIRSLIGWSGCLGGIAVCGLGLSAFVAPNVWFADNMSFFIRQFLAAGFTGLMATAIGFSVPHRAPRLYRTTASLLLVCFLLLSGLTAWRTFQFTAPIAESASATSIRIVSINLEQLYLKDETLTRYLESVRPDVLVFQETGWWWQRKRLSEQDIHGGTSPLPEYLYAGELGNVVVYSKFPIAAAKTIVLQGTSNRGRYGLKEIVTVSLSVSGRIVDLIAIHPTSPRSERRWLARQSYLDTLAEVTEATGTGPNARTIVIGDWNLSPWSAHFAAFFDRLGMKTAFPDGVPQTTRFFFDYRLHWLLGAVVDHVAISPSLSFADVRLGPNIGSDHLPLQVDVLFPTPASADQN